MRLKSLRQPCNIKFCERAIYLNENNTYAVFRLGYSGPYSCAKCIAEMNNFFHYIEYKKEGLQLFSFRDTNENIYILKDEKCFHLRRVAKESINLYHPTMLFESFLWENYCKICGKHRERYVNSENPSGCWCSQYVMDTFSDFYLTKYQLIPYSTLVTSENITIPTDVLFYLCDIFVKVCLERNYTKDDFLTKESSMFTPIGTVSDFDVD